MLDTGTWPFVVSELPPLPRSELGLDIEFKVEVESIELDGLSALVESWAREIRSGAYAVKSMPADAPAVPSIDIYPSSPRTVTIEVSRAFFSDTALEALLRGLAHLNGISPLITSVTVEG